MMGMNAYKTLIAKNLAWLIFQKFKTNPHAVAESTKVPQPTIHRILSGESRDPKTATLQPLATYFGVQVSDLREKDLSTGHYGPGNTSPGPAIGGKVPVISWVRAGGFAEALDNFQPGEADDWVEVATPVKQHTFALRVEGDSMEPDFPAGTLLIIEPEMAPEPGDFVIAKNGGDATFKQLVKDGPDWYLKPLNPRYPMKQVLEGTHIVGVVRESVRKFR